MMELVVPFRELINVVALAQALIFAGMLLADRFREAFASRILIFTFVIIATVKFDQLYQFMGGLETLPSIGFIFTPVHWLLTPSIYFFVLAKVNRDFHFRRQDFLHLAPAFMSLVYLSMTYFSLSVEGKTAYIQSGALGEPLNALIIPLGSDLIQLGYLVAALGKLKSYGISLRQWSSRTDDPDIVWIRRVLSIWVLAFLGHMVLILCIRVFEFYPFARIVLDLLNVVHLLLINALMVLGVIGQFRMPSSLVNDGAEEKYVGSNQSAADRRALFDRVNQEMAQSCWFRQMDLGIEELAGLVDATPRELSEAINGEGGLTFYDFINAFRVEEAGRLLIEEPGTRILDIAHRSGFNSKSTFNKVFKIATGQTPSGYRKTAAQD